MRFGPLPVAEAEGAILAHSVHAGGANWRKGVVLGPADLAALQRLLVPAPNDVLTMHPVSTGVNNVRNKGAELIEAISPASPT